MSREPQTPQRSLSRRLGPVCGWLACLWAIGWAGIALEQAVGWTDTWAGLANGLAFGWLLALFGLVITIPLGGIGWWIGSIPRLRRHRVLISLRRRRSYRLHRHHG